MSEREISVLKLGSSVLQTQADLPGAVHEVYRDVRQGRRVVVIVSAIGDATNDLLADARRLKEHPAASHLAPLLATAETRASALLALALDRAGIPARLTDARGVGLEVRGPRLDAAPVSLDVGAVDRALDDTSVLVLPGFVATAPDGGVALLGRGGSDVTALFVAERLGARECRLVKDTDGVFDADPRLRANARRFATLSFDDAKQKARIVVQEKALELAAAARFSFRVCALGSDAGTRIGAHPTSYANVTPNRPRLAVGLLGLGTVGGGVYERPIHDPELFDLTGVAVRRPWRHAREGSGRELLTHDPFEIVEGRAELIVELIGGLEPARSLIERALQLGKSVVTANKRVIARHGKALEHVARKHGADLLYSASVGGSLPAIEAVAGAAHGNRIRRIDAVLSGTCNFVLDAVADGVPFDDAVRLAQQKGFAEADPTLDLDGTDTAEKLALLAGRAFGVHVDTDAVTKQGICDTPLRGPSCDEARVRLVDVRATRRRRGRSGSPPTAAARPSPCVGSRGAERPRPRARIRREERRHGPGRRTLADDRGRRGRPARLRADRRRMRGSPARERLVSGLHFRTALLSPESGDDPLKATWCVSPSGSRRPTTSSRIWAGPFCSRRRATPSRRPPHSSPLRHRGRGNPSRRGRLPSGRPGGFRSA